MEPKDASHAIRYFFEGDFLPHRKAFQMLLPSCHASR